MNAQFSCFILLRLVVVFHVLLLELVISWIDLKMEDLLSHLEPLSNGKRQCYKGLLQKTNMTLHIKFVQHYN